MTALAVNAAMMHELLVSYIEAGFTRAEAMQVVLAITVEGIRASHQDGPSTDGS